jgi:hypothetical protein
MKLSDAIYTTYSQSVEVNKLALRSSDDKRRLRRWRYIITFGNDLKAIRLCKRRRHYCINVIAMASTNHSASCA